MAIRTNSTILLTIGFEITSYFSRLASRYRVHSPKP